MYRKDDKCYVTGHDIRNSITSWSSKLQLAEIQLKSLVGVYGHGDPISWRKLVDKLVEEIGETQHSISRLVIMWTQYQYEVESYSIENENIRVPLKIMYQIIETGEYMFSLWTSMFPDKSKGSVDWQEQFNQLNEMFNSFREMSIDHNNAIQVALENIFEIEEADVDLFKVIGIVHNGKN